MNTSGDVRKQIISLVRDFVKNEVKPVASKLDNDDEYPHELVDMMKELGLFGITIPEEYGGSGFNFDDMSILLEEMGRVGLSGPFFSTAITGVQTLLLSGTEEQKKEILPKIGTGQIKISLAFNEKTGSFDESEISNTTSIKNNEGWT